MEKKKHELAVIGRWDNQGQKQKRGAVRLDSTQHIYHFNVTSELYMHQLKNTTGICQLYDLVTLEESLNRIVSLFTQKH